VVGSGCFIFLCAVETSRKALVLVADSSALQLSVCCANHRSASRMALSGHPSSLWPAPAWISCQARRLQRQCLCGPGTASTQRPSSRHPQQRRRSGKVGARQWMVCTLPVWYRPVSCTWQQCYGNRVPSYQANGSPAIVASIAAPCTYDVPS
jgi:hypothetical protein